MIHKSRSVNRDINLPSTKITKQLLITEYLKNFHFWILGELSDNFNQMIQSIINRFIISVTKLLPLSFVRLIAGRYVAGEKQLDALQIVGELNNKGYSATIDILGEHSKTSDTAQAATEQYINLYKAIKVKNLDCNISIKPTHLGLDMGMKCVQDNVLSLLKTAEETDNFLRIDMENSTITNDTITLYYKCKEHYSDVGTVLQAYLYRSENDLKILSQDRNFNFRLCKGIYRENADIAIQGRHKINANFISLLRYAFDNNIYVGIATHDLYILETAYELITTLTIPSDRFEFQVLYGVPMSGWLQKHLQKGYKVRVYVPFGDDWYDYSLRRLKENPNIARYVFKNMFRR